MKSFIKEDKISIYKSPEIISFVVFFIIYISIRSAEKFIIPRIPVFLLSETKSLCRLGPVLFPIIFGITYYSNKKSRTRNTTDDILKKRMSVWKK